jgi:hypothetical protein
MQIALISDFDNGQQLQLLAEALRKYTDHDAIHLNIKKTFLRYDCDHYIQAFNSPAGKDELTKILRDYDDFFIFSEKLPCEPAMKQLLEDLSMYRKVTPNNTIIRTAGSWKTMDTDKLLLAWLRENWMFAGPYSDWFISGRVGRVAPVNYICPIDKLPDNYRRAESNKIRICFAPTKKEKGVDAFKIATKRLMETHDNFDIVPISKRPWKEAIKIKATCDITFDQLMMATYANSSIESMYLEHAVLSKISPWCRILHPDAPIIPVNNGNELYDALANLIENPAEIKERGASGKEYVMHWHHPKFVARQWANLIEHVSKK